MDFDFQPLSLRRQAVFSRFTCIPASWSTSKRWPICWSMLVTSSWLVICQRAIRSSAYVMRWFFIHDDVWDPGIVRSNFFITATRKRVHSIGEALQPCRTPRLLEMVAWIPLCSMWYWASCSQSMNIWLSSDGIWVASNPACSQSLGSLSKAWDISRLRMAPPASWELDRPLRRPNTILVGIHMPHGLVDNAGTHALKKKLRASVRDECKDRHWLDWHGKVAFQFLSEESKDHFSNAIRESYWPNIFGLFYIPFCNKA